MQLLSGLIQNKGLPLDALGLWAHLFVEARPFETESGRYFGVPLSAIRENGKLHRFSRLSFEEFERLLADLMQPGSDGELEGLPSADGEMFLALKKYVEDSESIAKAGYRTYTRLKQREWRAKNKNNQEQEAA